MVEKLRAGVRKRGMRQWLSHDVIAAEMFNEGWSSGKTGALIPWQAELTNLSDNALVSSLYIYILFLNPQALRYCINGFRVQ